VEVLSKINKVWHGRCPLKPRGLISTSCSPLGSHPIQAFPILNINPQNRMLTPWHLEELKVLKLNVTWLRADISIPGCWVNHSALTHGVNKSEISNSNQPNVHLPHKVVKDRTINSWTASIKDSQFGYGGLIGNSSPKPKVERNITLTNHWSECPTSCMHVNIAKTLNNLPIMKRRKLPNQLHK